MNGWHETLNTGLLYVILISLVAVAVAVGVGEPLLHYLLDLPS